LSNQVGIIANRLEALVKEVFPDAVKSQDKSDLGFGFGKGYKALVFVVSPQRTHVNLGVARGAELQAAFPLLQGSGKVHRHVKITTLEDLANPELRRLIKAALKAARARDKVGA
jgi:hypothetical protein